MLSVKHPICEPIPAFCHRPKKGTKVKPEKRDREDDVTAPVAAHVRGTDGKLHFSDVPLFTPCMSPQQVLEAGAFGGGYFRDIDSGITKQSYTGA